MPDVADDPYMDVAPAPDGPGDRLPGLVREGVLDAELAALAWLMVEAGVPLVVTGSVPRSELARVADVLVHVPPLSPALVIDLDVGRPNVASLAAFMRGGMRLAAVAGAPGLRELIDLATAPPDGLPEDAVRRLGLVLVLATSPSVAPGLVVDRLRVAAAHYLRPLERDAQGHVQRRPPAVLATWDPLEDAFDHFAWGVAAELADRVDRSQASFDERQAARAEALTALAQEVPEAPSMEHLLADEPPREPAPPRPAAVPSPVDPPLTDPHIH
jgi:hypothetical protein